MNVVTGAGDEQLRAPGGPVVAVRVMVGDGEPGTVIGHAVLPTPLEVARLSELWQRRGPLAVCASSSCFADIAWKERWLPALTSAGTMFVLVDVEPDRFIPAWSRAGREVIAIGIDVDDTSGRRTALVFSPDDGAIWWLVVANDITVNLVLEYLRDQLGPRLRGDAGQFAAIRDVTTVVVSHLLATESFVSFDALGGGHAER